MTNTTDSLNSNPYVVMDGLDKMIDELSNHMDLEEFREALNLVVVFLAKPKDVPSHAKVAGMITQLSAYSVVFRIQFANYMTWKKGTENAMYYKNCYKFLYEGIDNLVDSLKYWMKV